MKFAKIVFWIAGIWGVLTLTPLYFMFDLIGRKDPPPITHPAFFYGFVGAGTGLADRVFRHRHRPGALSPADDSFRLRKIQLRHCRRHSGRARTACTRRICCSAASTCCSAFCS